MNILILPVLSLMVCSIVAKHVKLNHTVCYQESDMIQDAGYKLSSCVHDVTDRMMELEPEPFDSTLVQKYCTELPKLLSCIGDIETSIKKCDEDGYITALKINLNAHKAWINRVCSNNAELLTKFSENRGMECIQNEEGSFQKCKQLFSQFLGGLYNKCPQIYNMELCFAELMRDLCHLPKEILQMTKTMFNDIYNAANCNRKSLALI